MSQVLKECFGSVISSLAKMRECTRCELLAECRAMNWTEAADGKSAAAGDDRPPERNALDSGSSDKSSPAGS